MTDSLRPLTSAAPPAYTWVATLPAFGRMLQAVEGVRRIAIDIEADSLYHYFEKVCLIQISTDAETFIIDPLALKNLAGLAPIMADCSVQKVFHAANYDICSLRRDHGFSFTNLFDTHIAAQLLGYLQLGLSSLMEKLLGVAHSKRNQRDDWSRRPLKREQLEYAAMDTHHLLALRDVLESQLRDKGRLAWAEEEFAAAADAELPEKEFDTDGFRRIKGSKDLSPKELSILQALYLLRDRYAREMDVPPFKVLNNPVLVDLARRPPRSAGQMYTRPGISFRVARNHGPEIYEQIEKARREDSSPLELPARHTWKPMSREAKRRLEKLKHWRQAKARELDLPVGVVFPGNLLELFAESPPADLPALRAINGMRNWRVKEFGAEILRNLGAA